MEETFSISIRGDYRVIKSHIKPTLFTVARILAQNLWRSTLLSRRVTGDVSFIIKVTLAPGVQWFAFVVASQDIARQSAVRQPHYRCK